MDATTTMLASGVIAVALITIVWAIEGALRPGYRPAYHPISALSLGPRGRGSDRNGIVRDGRDGWMSTRFPRR